MISLRQAEAAYKKYTDFLNDLTSYFQETLEKTVEAQAYCVDKRKFNEVALRISKIGYSGLADNLFAYLRVGNRMELAEATGVIWHTKNERVYFMLEDRIVFPLIDLRGNVIGYSGRYWREPLPIGTGKYINTPDTILFQKSYFLFGLYYAKDAIKERGFAVLVEGAPDVITPQAYGFLNVVAPLGTSFTIEQAYIIKSLCDRLLFCYDNDAAGQQSKARILEICKVVGLAAEELQVSGAKDIDEFIIKYGPEPLAAVWK